jgi:hypothetical protein
MLLQTNFQYLEEADAAASTDASDDDEDTTDESVETSEKEVSNE